MPATVETTAPVRTGSTAGWSDDGLWNDDFQAFDASSEVVDMTAKPGVTPGARRRLEQYWEERRLQDALKDAFDE